MVGTDAFGQLNAELRAQRRQHFDTVLETRQPQRWVDEATNGLWDNSVYPVLSPTGSVDAFAIYSRNITEERRLAAELQRYTAQLEQMVEARTAQLRRAKEQIEIILDNTSDAVALAQPNGDIETRNPAFTAMFGDQITHAIERILWTINGDEQSASVGNALMKVLWDRESQRVEAQITGENGQKDIDMAFIPVQLTEGDDAAGVLISAHDITHIREVERFKARFVADALHDLATPITALSTRLYLMKRAPEHMADHLRALENQVAHLRNLLADLRTLSQVDRREVHLELQLLSINEIVIRVYDTYLPVAVSRAQSLTLTTDSAMPPVFIDSRQMERVLVNLVSNAVNYTPEGKTIAIATSVEAECIAFAVVDEGIGISAEDLPRVFERFYRSEQARKVENSGTGLGLAIVKEIVELHGGSVTVSSVVDQGSAFTVRLPLNSGGLQ
jgi:two-component system phosphate regulon sensor histidine kinase PhoR